MLHVQNRLAKGLIERAGTRWPQTTADMAFRAFTRIPRPRGRRPDSGMPARLQPAMLQTADGTVATWPSPAEAPAGKRALLVHGWNSRSVHMLPLAESLNGAGIDVVLLDLPGHGASSGRHLHLGKGIEAIDAAWRHHGPFDAFVGHSFGGAIVLNAALGAKMCVPARRPETLVLLAAPNSMPAAFRRFGSMAGLPGPAQDAMERKVLAILGRSLDLIVASEQLKEYRHPVLVVHDMDDSDVLYADALRMARAGRHVELFTTSGLGHRRILKDAAVHRAICDRVAAGAGPRVPGLPAAIGDCA
ncbi:MAG: alpha/beta fold hydrolase [Oricola sp.]